MDLQDNLIESSDRKSKRTWAPAGSLAAHVLLIGGIVFIGMNATHKVQAEDKPIRAFVVQGAAPPPPPPPPPPPAASSAPKATPHIVPVQQKPIVVPTFHQPTEVPKEVPKPAVVTPTLPSTDPGPVDTTPSAPAPDTTGGQPGGVPGGVAGGVQGGVVGGQIGGEKGGVLGGEKGGVVGGQLGGTPGGTGTGTAGTGSGDAEAPKADAGPLRVGGDVKAPVATTRFQPEYTEAARKSRVAGIVVVEAIINKAGEVEQVKVIKGLPLGLSEQAAEAVKKWHFRPGTMNGQPVDVLFDLTVSFKLDS
jgi:protein TonB